MPNVYTRTGDAGSTGLFGGSRVAKQDPAVEAYGTVDEANAVVGEAKALCSDEHFRQVLHGIQQRLFVLAAELASDAEGRAILDNTISHRDVEELEAIIDQCLAETGPQRAFVVPGREIVSATLHRARTVTRRAERRILTAAETQPVRAELITYVNRLSDTLYSLARVAEHRDQVASVETLVRAAVAQVLGNRSTPSTAPAASHDGVVFDLDTAKRLAEAAEAKAAQIGVPIVFAAVDAGGNLMLLHRMPGSLLGSIDIATNKAFTSAAFTIPTENFKDSSAPGGDLHGIQNSNDGRVVVFGGGMPIFVHGAIAGGVGVSGGTVEQDLIIVHHALSTVWEATCP